jgi:hypothetical protein
MAESVRQYDRQLSLIAAPGDGQLGIELSALHVRFTITAENTTTPATLSARIYNASENTAKRLLEMPKIPAGQGVDIGRNLPATPNTGQVVLSAGYPGNFGIIFKGDLMQVRQGRESPADTYVDLFAADGDWAHVWGMVNTSLAAGYTHNDVVRNLKSSYGAYGVDVSELPKETETPAAPRGKVMFGMARDYVREVQTTLQLDAFIHKGRLEWLPGSAYQPGEAVVINSATGMIGLPQQTDFGLTVRMLLNPSVGPGTLLQIDNKSVQRAQFTAGVGQTAANQYLAGNLSADNDGKYKVLAVDHIGDTRGQEWYTDCVCIALAPVGPRLLPTDYNGYFVG